MNDKSMFIEELLINLKSPEASIRYDACEGLRSAVEITPEAIKALEEAVNDPDPGVADAARRALEVQLPSMPSPEPTKPGVTNRFAYRATREQTFPGKHISWLRVWIKAITATIHCQFPGDPERSKRQQETWSDLDFHRRSLLCIKGFFSPDVYTSVW